MSTTRFTIDDTLFRKELRIYKKISEQRYKMAVAKATMKMHGLAKKKVIQHTRSSKVRSSNLLNNIYYKIIKGGLTGEVESRMNYSEPFEKGTRPHVIRIKNKNVLAGAYRGRPKGWIVSKKSKKMGYATYGKQVHHPGTRAHPFMAPSFYFAIRYLQTLIKGALMN